MAISYLNDSIYKCNWCDKPAKYEVSNNDCPDVDRYCSSDATHMFCDERRAQQKGEATP